MRLALLWTAICSPLLSGCGEKGTTPPAKLLDPAEVLGRANELAGRHRVAEALQVIERSGATRVSASPPGDALLALREREAQLLLNLARPREAAEILEKLARLRPGSVSVRTSLARARLELGEPVRAAAAFEALGAALPAESLGDFGASLLGAGRARDSVSVLAACLIRDPWDDAASLSMGRALVRLGRVETGEAFLSRYRAGEAHRRAEQEALAFEVGGDEARSLHRRATAERERGRLFEAMQLDNRAIELNRGLGDAYLDLARLSIFLARPGDAVKVLEQLPSNAGAVDVLREAREAAAAEGDPRATARNAMKGKPLSACVGELLALGDELDRSGHRDDARRLVLFLARLSRPDAAAARAVQRLFDAPTDVFVRLWASEPQRSASGFTEPLAKELEPLGADAAAVARLLR
jgi:tetratricopeptide (TPR) repeat protein